MVLLAIIFGYLLAIAFCLLLILIVLLAIVLNFLSVVVFHLLSVLMVWLATAFSIRSFYLYQTILLESISNIKNLLNYLVCPMLSRFFYLYKAS